MHTILLLDDSRSAITALQSQTFASLFVVQAATSPSEALKLLDSEPVDCILSDFEMPEMNGPEFCRRLKANSRLSHIPVIILTAINNTENLITAIDAGADDFVPKDADIRIILAKIRAMVRIKHFQDEITKLRRVEGIKQIVATYNHEFNNPLTIALGNANWLKNNSTDPAMMTRISRLVDALNRMGDLVKRIRELRDYVESTYAAGENMVDIGAERRKKAS
jgi:DNA-binding response OmpR family regulator